MASSDIIKIGFDYRSSLAQFEKDTNGVFDGISSKAGKQKITIQLDAKDDKVIDKIKELQKLKLDKFTFEFGNSGLKEQLQTFDKLENKINEIINLSKGIGNSSAPIVDVNKSSKEIDKLESKLSELSKKYDELQKKSAAGGISGKEVNLVDNDEFKKLSQEVSELKGQFDDLKAHMQLLDDYTVPTDRFFELQTQIEATSVKVSDLVDEMTRLSNIQKNIGAETNISSASDSLSEASRNNNISDSIKKKKEALASYELQLEETRYEVEKLSNAESKLPYGFNRTYNDKKTASMRDRVTDVVLGNDSSSSERSGSKKWYALGNLANIDTSTLKIYQMWQEELQKVGYTLSEIRDTSVGLTADIIPIDGKAITNAEEFRKTLDSITTLPSKNVQLLNQQITELESKIFSLKSEIASLGSHSTDQRKDAFPDKDVSASVESVTNSIKEENNVLEQNTQKVKENTQAKEQNANVNLNKYDKRLDSYNGKIDKYKTTINRFNDGGWTSSTYLENVQAVKNAVHEYETLLNELKGKDASLVTSEDISNLDNYEKKIKDTIATVTNMSASEKGYNFVSGQKELDKIHKLLNENSKMSSEAKAKIKAYYAEIESGNPSMSLDKIHGEILKIYNAEVEAGRAGRTLFDTLKNSGFHQIAAQMAGMVGVYDVINGLKQVASTIRELDTAYTEMRKVSDESAQSLKNFQKESFSTADSVGTTALAMQDATATWMRLGESLDEAKESAKDATVLLNVSEFDNIDEATDSLVAMSQAYKDLDKMEIIDVLDKIGNEYSISTDELSTALKDSAAVLKTQGNDLAESVALITAGNAITQDASKTAGETLPERYRNIFYRTYLTARAASIG